MTRRNATDSKGSLDPTAPNDLSKDDLIALLLAQETHLAEQDTRLAELERRLGCENASNRDPTPKWFTALILSGNRGMQKGSRFARSVTPLKSGIHAYIQ